MTNWTAPQEPTPRRPKAGDTIASAAALATLDTGGNHLIVRDSNSGLRSSTNRVFAVHPSPNKRPRRFEDALGGNPVYPVTVLWSPWDAPKTDVPF